MTFIGIQRSLLVALAMALLANTATAAITAQQRREIAGLRTAVQRAGNLFSQEKFKESGQAVAEIQQSVAKLAAGGDADVLKQLESVYSSLQKAHALLELEGVSLPALKKLSEMAKPATAPTTPSSPTPPSTTPPADGPVDFAQHVAPILISKCGRCHVDQARGMLSMANYATLMRGNRDGRVVLPGDDKGSRIIEVISEGDMPRGGGRLSPEELSTLKRWIADGAKFAGDANAALATIAPASAPTETARLEVVEATGKETVSFANDIAPLLVANCNGCHIDGRRPSGRFNMGNFAMLLRGGDSGPPLAPGKPAASLIVQKLKGTASGQKMPAGGRPALADAEIAKIEKWISEGAKFDGPAPDQHIKQVAALAKAARSTHAELAAERAEQSAAQWQLGMPGVDSATVETENFLLIGTMDQTTLEDYGKRAEALLPQIAPLFHIPSDQPFIKGRLTLFFFPQRYDYTEFGKMVEKRQLPTAWRGHWQYNVIDAYGALIPPGRRDKYSNDVLMAQQMVGAYVATLGNSPPRWFAEGAARVAAAKTGADDPRVAPWKEAIGKIAATQTKPDDFLNGKLPPEDADILSYGFVEFLMKDAGRFQKLLASLRGSQDFEKAFSAAYSGSPAQAAAIWARSRR